MIVELMLIYFSFTVIFLTIINKKSKFYDDFTLFYLLSSYFKLTMPEVKIYNANSN